MYLIYVYLEKADKLSPRLQLMGIYVKKETTF